MIDLLRQKGLLAKRSIGGWISLLISIIWKIINSASTISWALGLTHASPQKDSGGSMHISSLAPSLLFVVGVLWLTAVVFVPIFRPNIYAKLIRGTFIAHHPYDDRTRSAMQALRVPFGPTDHDLVVKIFVVNKSIWATTVQRIEAEALIEDSWVKLRPSELAHYADEQVMDQKLAHGGLKHIAIKKIPLEDLLAILRREPLRRGIHKEGWAAFALKIDPNSLEKEKLNFRLSIIDAFDRSHAVLDVGEIDKDSHLTYSEKAIQQ